jgi:hypothetical protein
MQDAVLALYRGRAEKNVAHNSMFFDSNQGKQVGAVPAQFINNVSLLGLAKCAYVYFTNFLNILCLPAADEDHCLAPDYQKDRPS